MGCAVTRMRRERKRGGGRGAAGGVGAPLRRATNALRPARCPARRDTDAPSGANHAEKQTARRADVGEHVRVNVKKDLAPGRIVDAGRSGHNERARVRVQSAASSANKSASCSEE